MDDDEGLLETVRRCRAARGAALEELVRVIRAHKEVLLLDGALRVKCVWGCGGACVMCWVGAGGLMGALSVCPGRPRQLPGEAWGRSHAPRAVWEPIKVPRTAVFQIRSDPLDRSVPLRLFLCFLPLFELPFGARWLAHLTLHCPLPLSRCA